MKNVGLSAGTVDYVDTGGNGPVILLLHGLLMDSTLWDATVEALGPGYRCIAPTLPLGAHSRPMHEDADLSLPGIARLVTEFVDVLELQHVTVVGNDTGGAIVQLLACEQDPRLERLVLASCDAFDNFPPGLTGRTLVRCGALPPRLFGLFMRQMRLRPLRRLPFAFGWLTKRADAATARWVRPVTASQAISRDAVRVLRAIGEQRNLLNEVAERLPECATPTLVVWAAEDRVMPVAHGRRLAALLPHAQFVEVADSYSLLPLDQPQQLAGLIRDFVDDPAQARLRNREASV